MKTNQTNQSNLVHIDPANSALVKPSEAVAGDKAKPAATANERAVAMNEWAAKALEKNSESLAAKAVMKAAVASAVADYYKAMDEVQDDATAGVNAAERIEDAKQHVARAFADAVLAGVYDRSEMRAALGQSFGFEVSDKTGKPTSKPVEPGNTIAKRVSSVTIAAEYAMTGILPERGGESLPLLGQSEVADILADYFDSDPDIQITVRAASERIEKAIREARVSTPLEMDAEKVIRLAGKIETASAKIATDPELKAAYVALFQVIASIPFPDEMEEAA